MDADKLLYTAGASAVAYATWRLLRTMTQPYRSPLRQISGPPNPSWFTGVYRGDAAADILELYKQWSDEYGDTFKFNGTFGVSAVSLVPSWPCSDASEQRNILHTTDPRALEHVNKSSVFEKSAWAREHLIRILGEGVLVAEGNVHRKQRRIMNPAFGPAQIRELTAVFLEEAQHLRDTWISEINNADNSERARIEVMEGLSSATLDIIGLAGEHSERTVYDT